MRNEEEGGRSGTAAGAGIAEMLAAAMEPKQAHAYLEESTRLVRLQIAQLEEERAFDRFAHFSVVMKAAFEGAVALVLLVVLVGVGALVWTAAHDDGLVVQPFSVPSEMAARGVTGQVVAARLLDRLSALQAQTISNRAASSYANDWGDDIRVQIPETGISIGQLYTYLANWLGHPTRISGDILRNPDGTLSISARTGSGAGVPVNGPAGALGALIGKAAERIYAATQPYRYAVYLSNTGREKEAEAAYRRLIAGGTPVDRAWAYVGLSSLDVQRGQVQAALAGFREALRLRPSLGVAWFDLANLESQLQHGQAAYDAAAAGVAAFRDGDPSIDEAGERRDVEQMRGVIAGATGDFTQAHALAQAVIAGDADPAHLEAARVDDISNLASLHDGAAVAAAIARLPPQTDPGRALNRSANLAFAYMALEQWAQTGASLNRVETALRGLGPLGEVLIRRAVAAGRALMEARSGHLAKAEALIAATPLDCDLCLEVRGRIAVLRRDWKAADRWFALQARHAPGLPDPWLDWGRMRIAKGDADGAIEKLRTAVTRGPHYADPLEAWGEALMAKNRADLALAKFAEANRYAPDWGRLHLKWGEALMWSGDRAGARKQFAAAARLYLTADERKALTALKPRA